MIWLFNRIDISHSIVIRTCINRFLFSTLRFSFRTYSIETRCSFHIRFHIENFNVRHNEQRERKKIPATSAMKLKIYKINQSMGGHLHYMKDPQIDLMRCRVLGIIIFILVLYSGQNEKNMTYFFRQSQSHRQEDFFCTEIISQPVVHRFYLRSKLDFNHTVLHYRYCFHIFFLLKRD